MPSVIEVILFICDVVEWVSIEEKEEAKHWVEKTSGCPTWRDGYCMVDGRLIRLFDKPAFFREVYYNRKCNYSVNVQLITLPDLRISNYVARQCRSAHDSTVFKDSRCSKEINSLFSSSESMWGDSAYMSQT